MVHLILFVVALRVKVPVLSSVQGMKPTDRWLHGVQNRPEILWVGQ
jgi:hypothetical protein